MPLSSRPPAVHAKDVTIPSGATGLSAAIDCQGYILVGIGMPATWVAAAMTFQAADASDGTFRDVYDSSGTEKSVTVTADDHVVLDPANWYSVKHLKIRSGTSGTPVNQTAERTITLFFARPAM